MVVVGFQFQAAAAPEQRVTMALLEGQMLTIRFTQPQGKERPYTLGPWRFGAKVQAPSAGRPDKPHDRRLNLYIVAPGTQNQSSADEFDNNVIINSKPVTDGVDAEFDVYWAVVLDPNLRKDLRQERDLLIAAQEEFTPGDLFEFDDLMDPEFLRSVLKVESVFDLRRYRKPGGALPRVVIVPAGFALRASVAD
jgi:hypothetical protein